VVHVHSLYRFHTIAAAVVARRRHVPYVLQAHGSLNPPSRARRRRLKDAYHRLVEDSNIRNASLFLCTSTDEEAAVRELRYGVPTAVVPLGVDAAALREPVGTDHDLEHLGVRRNRRVITFLGRISREKGVELVFEAFELVAARLPDVQLVLAGPDDQGIANNILASGRGGPLSGRITAIGTIDHIEKRALLQRSSVLVLPSTGESFGLAVAEAMAVGCPVVVSPQVSLQHTIRASGAGLVVPRDAAEIAGAIESILVDPGRGAAMGEAGRRVVDTAFTWSVAAAELERIYDGIVRGVRGRFIPKEEPCR
jgi:glycosyltransferase involved in cell wall biosynthesis